MSEETLLTPLMRTDVGRGSCTPSLFRRDVNEFTIATPLRQKNEGGLFPRIRGGTALFMVPSVGDAAGVEGKTT